MNFLLSSDNNYAQHLGVTIYSLLDKNRAVDHICLWIVNNKISSDNKNKLSGLVSQFSNADIEWIDFGKWEEKLSLNMSWPISVSSYARLFIGSMLPKSVDRIIYMDCDMIVCDDLSGLWNTELGTDMIGAVQDDINDKVKGAVGLQPNDPYFNAGMLLIDLKRWRAEDMEEKCLKFINDRNGQVKHHDQGVLNGLLVNKWMRLPLNYNLMTIHYFFSLRQIKKYFNDHAVFYTKQEIESAKANPVILHFTPSFTSRPWVEGCAHPLKELYKKSLMRTPWRGAKNTVDNSKLYLKIINWRYRNLPY